MKHAVDLLTLTTLSVKEVACRLGTDGSHFARTFHQRFHVTPRAYRHGQRPDGRSGERFGH